VGLPKGKKGERKGVVNKERTVMETIFKHAQNLVYSLLALMPSEAQKASFKAMMGLFLGEDGHAVPEHTLVKSPSALSRFLNHYSWSTRGTIRLMRQGIIKQLTRYSPRKDQPLMVMIDLTSLEKAGQFLHLSKPTGAPSWVRWHHEKRGLHLVVLYLLIGGWRIPWSFRIWQGKGEKSPAQIAGKLLSDVPRVLHQGHPVIVLADTEFGTIEMFCAIHKRGWRSAIGVRGSRVLTDGRSLNEWYRQGKRGQQLHLKDIPFPLTVSWFWLKRQGKPPELRFVASTHPYSGAYLIRLGRKRWAIEGFFKTIKHRFGWHCFGQSTKLGVYRWLLLALIAYVLAYWIFRGEGLSTLDWRQLCHFTLQSLFSSFLWAKFTNSFKEHQLLAQQLGLNISLQPITINASTNCKI
jgi:hypothetical protein